AFKALDARASEVSRASAADPAQGSEEVPAACEAEEIPAARVVEEVPAACEAEEFPAASGAGEVPTACVAEEAPAACAAAVEVPTARVVEEVPAARVVGEVPAACVAMEVPAACEAGVPAACVADAAQQGLDTAYGEFVRLMELDLLGAYHIEEKKEPFLGRAEPPSFSKMLVRTATGGPYIKG
ncbi:unnamed protein product, partial [Prorocentrum cordatum]